ncbi:MAG: isoprenoid biosynthesis glyoxalase ElbB [Coraliomargarita sp.]
MKKVAVILSGCGVYDGAEIHESVLTLLALTRAGAEITCAAPDIDQAHVINHAAGAPAEGETRNVLAEAARISRGPITALSELNVADFDAIIFVGGFGAAKNLCNLAFEGANYTAIESAVALIQQAHSAGKALGFMCIAPALAAAALGDKGVQVTIGNDVDTAAALTAKGAQHIDCTVGETVVDSDNKVVTTPAYMLAENIVEAEGGINQLVADVLKLA